MEGSLQCINGSLWCLRLAEWQWLHWHASTIHNIEYQHNAQYRMHNVLDQITLLMCNTYSGVHLDICTACAHWTIFNTTCNMVSALLCTLHIMQHATCFLILYSAAIALHGCLCSATDHTDVCTPVSGAEALSAWETTKTTLPMSQSL